MTLRQALEAARITPAQARTMEERMVARKTTLIDVEAAVRRALEPEGITVTALKPADFEETESLAHAATLRDLYATYTATANVEAKEAIAWLCRRAGVGMEGWEG